MEDTAFKYLSVGITMIGATFGAAHGLSKVFATWLTCIARNPSAESKMKLAGFIGFAATELVLLMGFVIAILLMNK